MSNFVKLASGVDVLPIVLQIHQCPDIWSENTHRQSYPNSPHRATTSIWVRYRPASEITSLASFAEEHHNVFWPAWQALPALRPLVFNLMTRVQGVQLGSVLITKLPPGAEVLPHSDRGSWAAEFFNTKAHVTLTGQATVRCEGDSVVMEAGDAFTFNNLLMHSVFNDGTEDRIVCIVSMRCEV